MLVLNINRGATVVQALYEYDSDVGLYRFSDDILIGEWRISKIVRIGGPRTSIYKYDFKNYLESVITDKNGVSRIWQYYHNSSGEIDTDQVYDDDVAQGGCEIIS